MHHRHRSAGGQHGEAAVKLTQHTVRLTLTEPLRISRSTMTARDAVCLTLEHDGSSGHGEAVTSHFYGLDTPTLQRLAVRTGERLARFADPETALHALRGRRTRRARHPRRDDRRHRIGAPRPRREAHRHPRAPHPRGRGCAEDRHRPDDLPHLPGGSGRPGPRTVARRVLRHQDQGRGPGPRDRSRPGARRPRRRPGGPAPPRPQRGLVGGPGTRAPAPVRRTGRRSGGTAAGPRRPGSTRPARRPLARARHRGRGRGHLRGRAAGSPDASTASTSNSPNAEASTRPCVSPSCSKAVAQT